MAETRGRSALRNVQKLFPNVNRVVDANRPVRIEVEPADLDTATVRSHQSCAMAVACKRKMALDGVIMARKTAYLIRGRKATRYQVPEAVSREIVSFDRGAGFEPGTYQLVPFSPGQRLGAERNTPRGPHATTTTVRFHHVTGNVRAWLGGTEPETV